MDKIRTEDINYLKKYVSDFNLGDNYYNNCLRELAKGRPIQYVIGNVNFYGYEIIVNENVLIPRFETEQLVELTIKKIKKYFGDKIIDILDLGTGSGCIAITLAKEVNSKVTAIDISEDALDVARENAKKNNVLINYIHDDMSTYDKGRFDVIISNPPYIGFDEEIMEIVKNNEPHQALYADNHGLYFYEQIIKNIKNITKDKYLVAFEIGYLQGDAITRMAREYLDNTRVEVMKDYAGLDRFVFITNME